MIIVSLVIGCGFMRARFAWVLTVVWALSVFQELPPLHITTETYFDILTLPFVSWLLAAAFERSSRERWVRARTITRQLEEIRNVSSLRDIEQNRNRRLRERQRNQEQFLAAMSHELKTPLAGMIGMLRVAKLEHLSHKDPMHVNMCVTKALTCGQLLNSLVDDLLDRTRITTGKFCAVPTRIDLVEVVENVLGLASHLNRLNLKIDLKVDDSLRISTPEGVRTIMCYLDGDRIFQVLLNVVTNALKFTEEGGRIELSVKLHAASDGIADMPALEESSFLNKQRELNGRSTPVCYVEFKVKDTGVGIPANQIARCFQPFAKVELHETAATESGFSSVDTDDAHNADAPKQTEDGATVSEEDSNERKFTGSIGLGLHLCHEMVRIMGGVIDITSEVGKGTTVTITLPTRLAPHSFESFETTAMNPQLEATDDRPQTTLRAPAPAASRTAPPPSSSLPRAQAAISRGPSADEHVQNAPSETCGASLHPLRCLVVDDNLFNREVCAEYLSAMGHTAVIKAENGAEAVAMFTEAHERGEPFDVVLMDVMMPVMDGLSATQRIRELEARLRAEADVEGQGAPHVALIVAVTTLNSSDDQRRCTHAGMNGCLTKPISPSGLSAAIQSAYHDVYPNPSFASSPAGNFGSVRENGSDDKGLASTSAADDSSFGTLAGVTVEMVTGEGSGGGDGVIGPEVETGGKLEGMRKPLRCLVADDNLFNREVSLTLMTAIGHQVTGLAQNGAEAVAMFTEAHERGEPFDVVLMDVMMPVMDGLSATQRIRELEKAPAGGGSPAVVLATTACSQADEQEAGIRHGIDAYVTKPLSMKSLQDILAETVSSLQATEPPSRCVLPA